jgi:hypothetical protein
MAKLKFKNGEERLVLKGDEIHLVAALVEHVRLGFGDDIKGAASKILHALEESEYSGPYGSYEHDVNLLVSVEAQCGHVSYLDFNDMSYNIVFEATEGV